MNNNYLENQFKMENQPQKINIDTQAIKQNLIELGPLAYAEYMTELSQGDRTIEIKERTLTDLSRENFVSLNDEPLPNDLKAIQLMPSEYDKVITFARLIIAIHLKLNAIQASKDLDSNGIAFLLTTPQGIAIFKTIAKGVSISALEDDYYVESSEEDIQQSLSTAA